MTTHTRIFVGGKLYTLEISTCGNYSQQHDLLVIMKKTLKVAEKCRNDNTKSNHIKEGQNR